MKPGRTPCINPCCKRTGAADEFPGEMICGKCFKGLPQEVRTSHNFYWKQIRKWERRISKTTDELKLVRMRNLLHMWQERLGNHWDTEIKARVTNPEKPEGLEAFLEEVGL
jgi:hypothetical protein